MHCYTASDFYRIDLAYNAIRGFLGYAVVGATVRNEHLTSLGYGTSPVTNNRDQQCPVTGP